MDSKVSSIVITSVLAFALIAGIPAVFENVLAQQDGSGQPSGDAGMDQSQSGSDTGMDQSQSAVDAGMAQTQGNDTGFAQSQPGANMGGMTQDQGSAGAGSDDGEDNNDNDDNNDNEDKDNSEDE